MRKSVLSASVQYWLAEPLAPDVARSINRVASAPDVRHVAVLPDVHLAGEVCVGLVVATEELIYPSAVGGDIGCGMAAVRLLADADLLADESRAARLMAGLYGRVPANKHSRTTMPAALPEALEAAPLSDPRLEKLKGRDGRVQLGSLGRGNHFLEFQADPEHQLWLLVHSGSRGVGQAIAMHHLAQAGSSGSDLKSLAAASDAGRAYLADAAWAQLYAASNRLAIVSAAAELLRGLFGVELDEDSRIQSDHNHVRRETHFGREYWIHRKGAQSARMGEPGIIPGSMGTASFHTVGRGSQESMTSSSHGAGRRLTRTEARRTISARQLHREMGTVWFDHRRTSSLVEEAPDAYRSIHAVMRKQRELVRIVRELRPLLSYKGP
jgi:tRNA-splicing ligase RtcB (3'-phosphate/5'-hydroxy nucleic acid ligase)